MPIISLRGGPTGSGRTELERSIIDAVLAIEELELTERHQVTVSFDGECAGRPTALIATVQKLLLKPRRTLPVCKKLASAIGRVLFAFAKQHSNPYATVEAFVDPLFDTESNAYFATKVPE